MNTFLSLLIFVYLQLINSSINITKVIYQYLPHYYSIQVYRIPINYKNNVYIHPSHKLKHPFTVFSTVETNTTILHQTIQWYSTLQKENLLQFVLFTKSNAVFNIARRHFTVIRDYMTNNYSLPIINSMFYDIRKLFHSTYYCYINIDILLESSFEKVFKVLNNYKISGKIPPSHEIVGRVSVIDENEIPKTIANSRSLNTLFNNQKNMRNDWSAV